MLGGGEGEGFRAFASIFVSGQKLGGEKESALG